MSSLHNVLNLNPRTILHDNQALMRYELLYTPTDLGKASPGLTGVRDEVNDVKAILGVVAASCNRSDISSFTASSSIGLSSVSLAASAMAASWPVNAANGENCASRSAMLICG